MAEGVPYTCVKKFKTADEPVASGDLKAMQAEMAKLKAELRRTTEERDILKRPPRTLPNSQGEVCVHKTAPYAIPTHQHVSRPQSSSQWLLRMAA